jgi:SNF2 family DNA or RNA helicase
VNPFARKDEWSLTSASGFTPFPFQLKSVHRWANEKKVVPNILLGDDMGLGKTVTAICLDARKRELAQTPQGHTLVICPLSVIDVWEQHFAEWNPKLKVRVIDPKNREAFFAKGAHVYIMHWDALRLMPEIARKQWFHVIADEAHRAKNRKAQITQALKRIHTYHKLALTGTPADDKPQDIWSILNWLWPKTYSSYWRFYNDHVEFTTHPKGGYKIVTGVRNIRDLHEGLRPFYMRRTKEEVLPELPAKTYSTIHVDLTPRQRKAYDQMKSDMLAWVGENEDKPVPAPIAISKLMRLQQFALTHMDVEEDWKQRRLKDHERAALQEYEALRDGPFEKKFPWLVYNGERARNGFRWAYTITYKMVEPSSKLDALMQLIEDNPHESFVIFSQFKQTINLLGHRLLQRDISYGLYTGDTDKSDRDSHVRNFQAGKIRVFAGTIRAGGEGITLTRARTMVFTDRDWSPSKNVQAEDRIYRVGQENAVQIIDLVSRNTVDRGRLQQIAMKWETIKKFLGEA